MLKRIQFILLISIFALSGCGTNSQPVVGEQIHLTNGDLQEVTASIDQLPKFLAKEEEYKQMIYLAAAKNSDILKWIPCYCGCSESAGHENNSQCFYKEIHEDGSIIWDDHGTRCGTCMEIAAYSITMKNEGKSTLEIRNWIDEKYGNGQYANPTPTPMPQG